MSPEMRLAKLQRLCEIEGDGSAAKLFAAAVVDTVCPAICCNPERPECEYTAEMEPDQEQGWCEECGRPTMASALVLWGVI